MSIRVPIGVVGAITPWNFPVAIPSWKLVPALICGNTVVPKPAEDTPALAERFVALLSEAGIADGVVNIVHGYGEQAGEALVRHPDVPVITFTGSRETGILVAKGAAERLKHLHVELGGKNAIIVLDDEPPDLDLAVDAGIAWSAFGTSGPSCTAASRVIVQRGALADELAGRRLVARAEAMRLGPGWEDSSDIGPVHQPGCARQAIHSVHRDQYRTRAPRCSRVPASPRPTATSARASTTTRPSSGTSRQGCGSRTRRSSARLPPGSPWATSTR